MFKKIFFSVATAALLLTGGVAPTAHAATTPLKAGDTFYTTAPSATSVLPRLPMVLPATRCTITAIPQRGAALTAAHCFREVGQPVWDKGGQRIGTVVGQNIGHDIAVIKLKPNVPQLISRIASRDLNIGDQVSKTGATTGTTSGTIISGLRAVSTTGSDDYFFGLVEAPYEIIVRDVYLSNICAKPGDSGAPVFYRGYVVGIISSVNTGNTCSASTQSIVVHLGKAINAYNKSRK